MHVYPSFQKDASFQLRLQLLLLDVGGFSSRHTLLQFLLSHLPRRPEPRVEDQCRVPLEQPQQRPSSQPLGPLLPLCRTHTTSRREFPWYV